jgi:WD40 repeat protein
LSLLYIVSLYLVLGTPLPCWAGTQLLDPCNGMLLPSKEALRRLVRAYDRLLVDAGMDLLSTAELQRMLKDKTFFDLDSGGPAVKGRLREGMEELRTLAQRIQAQTTDLDQDGLDARLADVLQALLRQRAIGDAHGKKVKQRIVHTPLVSVTLHPPHQDFIASVQSAAQGSQFLTLSCDGRAALWDADSGKNIGQLSPKLHINHVAVSPNDSQAIISLEGSEVPRLIDLRTSKTLFHLRGHSRIGLDPSSPQISSVAYAPDGSYAVSTSRSREGIVWSTQAGEKKLELKLRPYEHERVGHCSGNYFVRISEDSRYIAISSEDTVRIWDSGSGQLTSQIEVTGLVNAMLFSPDSKLMITSGHRSKKPAVLEVWAIPTGEKLHELPGQVRADVAALSFSQDSARLAASGQDGIIRIYDLHNGRLVQSVEGCGYPVLDLGFTPDGKYLLSGSNDAFAYLWDLNMGKCIQELGGHRWSVEQVLIMPRGHRAITADYSGKLKLWHLDTLIQERN